MENQIQPDIIQPNVPPVELVAQPLVPPTINGSRIILFVVLGLIVVAGLVFIGIQIGKGQGANEQSIPIIVQPTVFPSSTTIPTAPVIISPTVNPTTNWKIYSNESFTFRYPSNLSPDYTSNGCIYTKIGLAYLAIKSPGGSIACGQTGRGSYDEITNIEETTSVGDKKYISTLGNLVDMSKDPDAKTKYLEFLRFDNVFVNDSYIEYGGYFNTEDRDGYQDDKKIIYQILSTFKFLK